MPRYELVKGTSSKFWEISLAGRSFTTTYGRIGAAGQSTTKTLRSPELAAREHDKLVGEKVRKGYKLAKAPAKPAAGKASGSAAAAAYLTALTAKSLRDARTKDQDIIGALLKVGDALPAPRLRAVLLLITKFKWWMLFAVLARKPLPHLEPLVAPVLRARRPVFGEFRPALFAAAADAGLVHETARVVKALDGGFHIPHMATLAPKVDAPPEVLDVARPVLARYLPKELQDDSLLLTFGFVSLLAKEGSKASLDAIERFANANQKRDEFTWQGTILMVEKAGKGAGAAALAARLWRKETKRRAGTQAQALADALALPMRDQRDWRVTIYMAVGRPPACFGYFQQTIEVRLSLDPKDPPEGWEVEMRNKGEKRSYQCRGGEMLSNDFHLPPLKRLRDFPGWLARASKKIGKRFSIAHAKFFCGDHRAAVTPLRAWLQTAG